MDTEQQEPAGQAEGLMENLPKHITHIRITEQKKASPDEIKKREEEKKGTGGDKK